jgi:hypothetical protein
MTGYMDYRVICYPDLDERRKKELYVLIDNTTGFDNHVANECWDCIEKFGADVDCNGCYFMRNEREWLKDFIKNHYDDFTNCDNVYQIELPCYNVWMIFSVEPPSNATVSRNVWNAFYRLRNAFNLAEKLGDYLTEDMKREISYREEEQRKWIEDGKNIGVCPQ